MARNRCRAPVLDEIRHEHHLDESIVRQYGWWLRGIVTFDFGTSFIDHRPVTERIAREAAEHDSSSM